MHPELVAPVASVVAMTRTDGTPIAVPSSMTNPRSTNSSRWCCVVRQLADGFERCSRIDGSRSRLARDTGLGPAINDAIVEADRSTRRHDTIGWMSGGPINEVTSSPRHAVPSAFTCTSSTTTQIEGAKTVAVKGQPS